MLNKTMQKLGEERSVIRELFEYGNARKKQIGEENVFDFSIGNPSAPSPLCVEREIAHLLADVPPAQLHGYTSAQGAADVREAVARYLTRTSGVPMSADLVYMTCGAAASLAILLNALCEEGDEFVVLAPFFPEYRVFVEQAGGKLVVCPTDERFQPDLSALEKAITRHTKAVIINSPNNPTGAIYREEILRALGGLLRRKSEEKGSPVFLLSDEPYRELSYGSPAPYPVCFYRDTAVCYSFSKTLSLAGERIGFIALPRAFYRAEEVYAAVCGAGRALGYVCAPALFQRVCAACLGQTSDLELYRANRDLLYGALTSYGYECVPPDGAFYLFVKSLEPSATAFCERAKRHELLLVPSDSFGKEGYVRISYCVARSVIERSLPAFERLMREYRG